MARFVLVFILTLCCIQGLQGYSAGSPADRSLSDVIEIIQDIVQKIKQTISDITSGFTDIVEGLKNKIEEIVSQINIPGMISKLGEEIKEILAHGVGAKKCADAAFEQLGALNKASQIETGVCISKAMSIVSELEKVFGVLIESANSLNKDIKTRFDQCVADNKLNIPGLIKCLQNQIEPIKQSVENIQGDIGYALQNAKAKVQESVGNFASCMGDIETNIIAKGNDIVSEARQCVNELDITAHL